MSAKQMYPKVSGEGLLGSTYMKISKVLTTAASTALRSSSLVLDLGKSINLVIGESPTTLFNSLLGLWGGLDLSRGY